MQTFAEPYNPAYAGESACPWDTLAHHALCERKVIARRGAGTAPQQRDQFGHRHARGRGRVAAEERIIDS